MEKDNKIKICLKHILLIILFILTFLIFLYYHFDCSLGLFFDLPAIFSELFYQFQNPDIHFYTINVYRIREFTCLLVMIPFNILYHFFSDISLEKLSTLLSMSYYIVHIGLLLFNIYVAKITKRYDIAVLCFAFYAIFCIPNLIWSCREIHIAILFYFAILSFFLSKQRLKKVHLLLIIPMLVYLFESFETSIIFGIIMFIASLKFYKLDYYKNKKYQILIGIGSFLASIYITLKLLFIIIYNNISNSQSIGEWVQNTQIAFQAIFSSSLIISFMGILALIFIIFYKKDLNKKSLLFTIPYILFTVYFLYLRTYFIPNTNIEITFWGISFVFIFPTIILILLINYKNLNINEYNNYFYSNLILLACVIGILNLSWQILDCNMFKKYTDYLNYIKKRTNDVIITIPEEDYNKYDFVNRNNCYGQTIINILITKEYRKEQIFFPSTSLQQESYCAVDSDQTYYNSDIDTLIIQNAWLPVKNKYWDLTPIAEEFKKRGLVK